MEKINSTIWNHHNTTVKDWERSLNINKQKKKFYRHHHNLSLDYPNLNMDDNRQRNNYVVRFNPNHSTPYNRSSGFSDNGAHIKWMSRWGSSGTNLGFGPFLSSSRSGVIVCLVHQLAVWFCSVRVIFAVVLLIIVVLIICTIF
ncbi:unnamed protein product [Rhizophagus irregularis]|nr:unnamed protein product [Rhizophagus irregularis]